MTRIGKEYRPVTKNGRTVLVKDDRASESKLNVSLRLKRRKSKKITVKRGRS